APSDRNTWAPTNGFPSGSRTLIVVPDSDKLFALDSARGSEEGLGGSAPTETGRNVNTESASTPSAIPPRTPKPHRFGQVGSTRKSRSSNRKIRVLSCDGCSQSATEPATVSKERSGRAVAHDSRASA